MWTISRIRRIIWQNFYSRNWLKSKIDSQAVTLFETVSGRECETSTCFLRWLRKFTIQSSRTQRALLYVVLKTFLSAFRNEWRVCAHPVDIYLKSFLELPQHLPNHRARWAKARKLAGEHSKSTDRKVRTNLNRNFGGFHFFCQCLLCEVNDNRSTRRKLSGEDVWQR